jgi:NhaA family Na+:H+ antiporter
MGAAIVALVWANSPFRGLHEALFHSSVQMKIGGYGIDWTVHHFTNDALMTLFFAVAGLEIKRELSHGELRSWGRAALPLIAAAGGMVVPALIYLALNHDGVGHAGWGVPMATDLAFALGCLSLVKRRVPPALFVFLTALAIFDDLGAIVVIAIFYGQGVDFRFVAVAAVLAAGLLWLGRAGVQKIWPYALFGFLLWAALLRSGLHATLAGVVVGLSLPTEPKRPARDVLDDLDVALTSLRRDCDRRGSAPDGTIAAIERHIESVQSPLDRAMHALHSAVAFGVVPLFALANAGVALPQAAAYGSSVTLGALLGLSAGKPLGVGGATFLAVKLGLAPKPTGSNWLQILAVACVAGVGFTMSLLVGNLAFGRARGLEDQAKLGVIIGSVVSVLLGVGILLLRSPRVPVARDQEDVPVVLDVPRFAQGYGVRPIVVGENLLGQTLAKADVRRRFGVTVIGRWSGQGPATARKLEPLNTEQVISEGDVLLVAGADDALEQFARYADHASEPPARLG